MSSSFYLALLFLVTVPGSSRSQVEESEAPRYLARVTVLEAQPSSGEVTLQEPDGASRRLTEGDRLAEEDEARLYDVTSSTLVFKKTVTGPSGEPGESLIVVRYDPSGKTKVHEYSTVGDVAPPGPAAPTPKPNPN